MNNVADFLICLTFKKTIGYVLINLDKKEKNKKLMSQLGRLKS
ncbi:MAG: hypothetical protein BAJALOKI3v1_300030 [Promethearchaeota archaeon]|nr:MAG: hypothetical protein BAJALOKI3v1_300030 [Candidatus Lokiarchaeota archaeon]